MEFHQAGQNLVENKNLREISMECNTISPY